MLNKSKSNVLTFREGRTRFGVQSGDQVEVVEGVHRLELVLIDRLE